MKKNSFFFFFQAFKMNNIVINVSDVFTWLCMNPWGPVSTFEKFWKRFDSDYDNVINLANKKVQENENTEHVETIKKNIYNISTSNLQKTRDLLKEEFSKLENCTFEQQQKIINDKNFSTYEKKHIVNYINTNHGIQQENSVLENHESDKKIKLDKTQTRFEKDLDIDNSNYKWLLVGRMDGINHEEKTIVEIKNRTKGLFHFLKDYENVQLQLYMYLSGLRKCILIEKFKNKSNEIHQEYDEKYVCKIIANLYLFCENFEKFINMTSEEKFEKYFSLDDFEKRKYLEETLFEPIF